MRRIKPTPLFIISIGLILFAIYTLLFFKDPEGWGILGAIIFVSGGLIGLIIYLVLRVLCKTKVWTQIILEIIIIASLIFYDFKRDSFKEIEIPTNFNGFVLIIYGVQNSPKLTIPFYSNKVKLNIPESGIISTSSDINDIKITRVSDDKTYNSPYQNDSVVCNGKKYAAEIWLVKHSPIKEQALEDSIFALKERLILACSYLKP
jgi:hypothetical protein